MANHHAAHNLERMYYRWRFQNRRRRPTAGHIDALQQIIPCPPSMLLGEAREADFAGLAIAAKREASPHEPPALRRTFGTTAGDFCAKPISRAWR